MLTGRLAEEPCGVARRQYNMAQRRSFLRPSQRSRCGKKSDGSGGQEAEVLDRGCSGNGRNIHCIVNPIVHPVRIKLTGAKAATNSHPSKPFIFLGWKGKFAAFPNCSQEFWIERELDQSFDHGVVDVRVVFGCIVGQFRIPQPGGRNPFDRYSWRPDLKNFGSNRTASRIVIVRQ